MKKKLLLHSCCGPCSTAVIERLYDDYQVTVFYYNPNITEEEEYRKRRDTQLLFLEKFNRRMREERGEDADQVAFLEGLYDVEAFYRVARGLEAEPEGGARCEKCFRLRLSETAERAENMGFDYFTTTLSVSPYKNAKLLNQIGEALDQERYLPENFKKKDGYRRSVALSNEYGLYRQHYCGCGFAKVIMERQMAERQAREAKGEQNV